MSFVTGGGGAVLYSLGSPHAESVQYFPTYNFLKVAVDRDETIVEAIGLNGVKLDQVHIAQNPTPRKPYASSWHSPALQESGPSDGDGNITGQKFDFAGQPIPGLPGKQSSAGRLFVNNDGENLYLGFDELALRSGDELFVFVQTPGLSGVPQGASVPHFEGSENSLNYLGNLVFTNMTPALGLVLGDDYGDAFSSTFVRAGSSNQTGQGVFYLTNGFPPVANQRITQFSHSPQDFGLYFEQNANFIKISWPYAALGLNPGDPIRVGAVVGLSYGATNRAAAFRGLDGFIGFSRQNAGVTNHLEGIEISLAENPDLDGDGLLNDEEFTRGTDPRNPDSDGDGLPDGWEVAFAFDPLNASGPDGGVFDSDGDGAGKLDEFRAGTHPRDPFSKLILSGSSLSKDRIQLQWSTVPGKKYLLQFRDGWSDPFKNVIDDSFPRTATSTNATYALTVPPSPRDRYFRIQVLPE